MILTVDIGNSNIVLGMVEGNEILFEARLRTDATKTSDEYCIDVKMILEVYEVSAKAVEGAIISSVVPQVLNSIKTAIKNDLSGYLFKTTKRNPMILPVITEL